MLRRFFARFLVTIFVSLAVSFSFLLAVYFTLVNEGFYQEKLSPLLQNFFVNEITKKFEYEKIALSKDEFKSVLRKTFSEDEIYVVLKSLFDDFVNNFSDEGVTLSLKWLQTKNADLSKNLASAIFLKLEKCKTVQNFNFDEGLECLPFQFGEKDLALKLKTELDIGFFSKIPTNARIDVQFPPFMDVDFVWNFSVVKNLIFIFPGVLFFLLISIFFLIGRPWMHALKWVLTAILIAAVLIALVLAVLNFVLLEALDGLIDSSGTGNFYTKYLIDLVRLFFTSLTENMIRYLLPLGAVMLFSLIWLVKRSKMIHNSSMNESQ